MSFRSTERTAAAVLAAFAAGAGCSAGLGPSTAATRPVLGQTISSDKATMWGVSSNQSGVPRGFVRVEQVADGFARLFNYVSVTSALKAGSVTAGGMDHGVLELDAALTGRIPLPIGGISLGVGRVWAMHDTASLQGTGIRASIAPIAQLSIDVAHSWVSGTIDEAATIEASGAHTSLGGTVLLWGWNQFRFGVAVAKTWTSAGAYDGSGYTYTLMSTMY